MDGQCGSQYSRRTVALIQGEIHHIEVDSSGEKAQIHEIVERRLLDPAGSFNVGRTVPDDWFSRCLSSMIY